MSACPIPTGTFIPCVARPSELNNTAGAITKKMTPEEIDGYAERNKRLRELCGELNNLV